MRFAILEFDLTAGVSHHSLYDGETQSGTVLACAEEGADLLMVKPGMSSIDLIKPILQLCHKPVGAYQVSGEYAAMSLLADNELIDFEAALLESWQVMKRAGAQFIISYGSRKAKALGVQG